ncbi:hypothetical protein BaRGS_00030239 [Batillaria attramentaria]|uniref:Uncharacterized protein n=1 Tax=Batillaria attramentaria TaxID=370345 RepID=A0ABD0JUX8_9CAEN
MFTLPISHASCRTRQTQPAETGISTGVRFHGNVYECTGIEHLITNIRVSTQCLVLCCQPLQGVLEFYPGKHKTFDCVNPSRVSSSSIRANTRHLTVSTPPGCPRVLSGQTQDI